MRYFPSAETLPQQHEDLKLPCREAPPSLEPVETLQGGNHHQAPAIPPTVAANREQGDTNRGGGGGGLGAWLPDRYGAGRLFRAMVLQPQDGIVDEGGHAEQLMEIGACKAVATGSRDPKDILGILVRGLDDAVLIYQQQRAADRREQVRREGFRETDKKLQPPVCKSQSQEP